MNEFAWKEEFVYKIEESKIPHEWDLCVDMYLVKPDKGMIYTQYTFGSFRCSRCARSWNSSKVFVLFLLNLNKRLRRGTVKMRIFRQNCENCNHSVEETPTITSENIARVACNLVQKIQSKFYGVKDENEHLKPKIYGNLDGPHNRVLCEACRYGLCERQMPSAGYEVKKNQGESSTLSILSAIVVGVGALALMYLTNK